MLFVADESCSNSEQAAAVGLWALRTVHVHTLLLRVPLSRSLQLTAMPVIPYTGLLRQTQAHDITILMMTAANILLANKQLGSGWLICKAVF